MNYLLNKRCTDLLEVLLYNNQHVKISELASTLSISNRSIYYDIQKINDFFSEHGIDPLVQERRKGIVLDHTQRDFIQNHIFHKTAEVQFFTPEERYGIEMCELFFHKKNLYVEDFVNICEVSRNTIINDLRVIADLLPRYNLSLSYNNRFGYTIVGEPIKVRALFFQNFPNLWRYYSSKMSDTEKIQFKMIAKKLRFVEHELNTEYVSDIIPVLAMFILNLSEESHISFNYLDQKEIMSTKEFQLISNEFDFLPKNEQLYITLHLLGSRLQTVPVNISKNDTQAYDLSIKLVRECERLMAVRFENEEKLINAIHAHLRSSLYRFRYGIRLENPMLENIKTEYSDLFSITKKSCQVLENELGVLISDAEVAYLALHFGAFIVPEEKPDDSFRVLIICPNGVGTSRMLKNEVSVLIPHATEIKHISLKEYRQDHGYDLVISTIYFAEEKDLIVVHPILTDQDRVSIIKRCLYNTPYIKLQFDGIVKIAAKYIPDDQINAFKNDLQQYYYSMMDQKVLPPKEPDKGLLYHLPLSHIRIINEPCDWEAGILASAEPLLAENFIQQSYVDAIIESQKYQNYYMFLTKNLVLAHSNSEDNVMESCISLATFKEPVRFLNNEDAKIIITFASKNKSEHLQLLNDIIKVFSKQSRIHDLCDFDTIEQIRAYLEEILKE